MTDEQNRRDLLAAIVAVRRSQGLTQEQVAERMGVSQSTVSEFERSSDPRFSTVQRYAHALGCTIGMSLPLYEEET